MLSDFLTLELYFGTPEAALFFEDLSKRYNPKDIIKALTEGDLDYRIITNYHICNLQSNMLLPIIRR